MGADLRPPLHERRRRDGEGSATHVDEEVRSSPIVAAQGIEPLLRAHAAASDAHDPGFLSQQSTRRGTMVAALR